MIYDVDRPLGLFIADCGHKESVFLPSGDTAHQTGSGVQPDLIRLSQKSTYAETGFLQFEEPGCFKKCLKHCGNVGLTNTYRMIPNNTPLSSH